MLGGGVRFTFYEWSPLRNIIIPPAIRYVQVRGFHSKFTKKKAIIE